MSGGAAVAARSGGGAPPPALFLLYPGRKDRGVEDRMQKFDNQPSKGGDEETKDRNEPPHPGNFEVGRSRDEFRRIGGLR